MSKFVRLYPTNRRLGFMRKRHTIMKPENLTFKAENGWYKVSDEVAAALEDILQDERNPTLKAFIIADTAEDAKKADAKLEAMLRKAEDKPQTGTPDKPVNPGRPGHRAQAESKGKPKGRTRKKKDSGDSGDSGTSDED